MPTAALRDHGLRTLRALRMMELRITGNLSLEAIGAQFNVQGRTVTDELKWAQRQGILQKFEEQILSELVPGAVSAIKQALSQNNSDVALEILKGTGLLRKPAERPALPPGHTEESLEVHVKRITSPGPPVLDGGRVQSDPALGPSVLEAEVVENRGEGRAPDPNDAVDLADYLGQRDTQSEADPHGDGAGPTSGASD